MSLCREVITLNVGGVLHTTTRSTLTKYSDSMLAAMFGGSYTPTSFDQERRYFIDRDGHLFTHVLNFLRSGRLVLPKSFQDTELLELEADFYQIPALTFALNALKDTKSQQKASAGHYLELLDCEETAYFYRFYSDPPKGINTELKNSGVVLSGATHILKTLPLPEKSLKDLQSSDAAYRTINVSSAGGLKMLLLHHLTSNNWILLNTSFNNSTNHEGSYMVHRYLWHLPS